MKTQTYVLLFAVLTMAACQPKTETAPVGIAAVEDAVTAVVDNYHKGVCAGNVNDIKPLLEDKGLYCGTDPIELWDKETVLNLMTEGMADSSYAYDYSIDKRITRVAADGKTALVLDQTTIKALSKKIPIRFIFHLVKTNENWKIDFLSCSFIPKNEDIVKLDLALE